MDIGRLHRRWQALRIGHRREIAVICIADPARARQIGAVFPGAAAAEQRLIGRVDDIGIEAVAAGRETGAVEIGIAFRAGAKTVVGERRLMAIDESHAVAGGIAAQHAGLAQRERLQFRQEFVLTKFATLASRCGAALNEG